ncbi:peptidoglycan DD-metalloendopeptidase family protein [Wenzhouxiangella sp. EGI_FJ10305]|uniref:peptidoglycan DD-metalloendopeptidase family protein n=1 Tax=Wenzhouxiangella sp. EGI_FJ10305 TaxID=3243768 RepID=UPI0035E25B90
MSEPKRLFNLLPAAAVIAFLASCNASDDQADPESTSDWPADLIAPIEGATFSLSESHLPGAPRDYREGSHQGFDFFNGLSSRPLAEGEAVVAVADGEVIRIDRDYDTPEQARQAYYSQLADDAGFVGEYALDQLRGRQVWIRHEAGHVSRYAHLSEVHPELQPGDAIEQGRAIGLMGNTGIPATEDQPDPAPHLHFELWSADGERFLGKDRTPLATHQAIASIFGPEALPRYARQVVSAVEQGEPAPDSYPPEERPDVGFTVDPPSEIAAGEAFAVPITWEDDHFGVEDFFSLLEGTPLGIIDAGDGAWILGAVPIEAAEGDIRLTVGAADPYGQSLVGQRDIAINSAAETPAPIEVDPGVLDRYSDENLQTESQQLARATFASLRTTKPRWDSEFQAPLNGDVVGEFGQRMVSGPMAPFHPRPGYLIRPDDNSRVLASNDGVVALVEELPIRGQTVAIDHGGGVVSIYAHLDSSQVEQGQAVSKGEAIGIVGRSGAIDDDLLRWEIHVAGIPSDPRSWLDSLIPGR